MLKRAVLQQLNGAVADRFATVDPKREAAVRVPANRHDGIEDVVVDGLDGDGLVGLDADGVFRTALDVEQTGEDVLGLVRQVRAVGDDTDPARGSSFQEAHSDRQQGDDDREDGQRDRRDVEQPRTDELTVFAPGDVGCVRKAGSWRAGAGGRGPWLTRRPPRIPNRTRRSRGASPHRARARRGR